MPVKKKAGGKHAAEKPGTSIWSRHGFVWVTLLLFVVALGGQWLLGWYAYLAEQQAHHAEPVVREFLAQIGRDTLENWQSEFLQLVWQVAGLALLFHVGSPQSKEGDDRKEEKIDAILRLLDSKGADEFIKRVDQAYGR
jgi:Domain of unknown function (DUF6766)